MLVVNTALYMVNLMQFRKERKNGRKFSIMKTITIKIPNTVDFDDKEVVLVVASKFYEKGKLSLGQASEIAGLSKRAFMEILKTYGVSIINHPSSDLNRDVENAKNYNR